jgi:hypothetical protein
MKNVVDQMCEDAIDQLVRKIEWRKDRIANSNRKAIAILMGNTDGSYTYEQTCAGIVSLQNTMAIMEQHLAALQPPVVEPVIEPVKAKRGRPSKK